MPPKTPWGDPNIQGVWTSNDSYGVPFERPMRYGKRKLLNNEEYVERAKENDLLSTSIKSGVYPNVGYWAQHEGVEAQPYPSNWSEYASRTSRQTSLIVDPEDGHLPALTPKAMFLRAAQIAAYRKKPVQNRGKTQHVRALYHARRLRLHVAGDVRKRDGDHPVTRTGGNSL